MGEIGPGGGGGGLNSMESLSRQEKTGAGKKRAWQRVKTTQKVRKGGVPDGKKKGKLKKDFGKRGIFHQNGGCQRPTRNKKIGGGAKTSEERAINEGKMRLFGNKQRRGGGRSGKSRD